MRKHLLGIAGMTALTVIAAQGATFEWQPVITSPNPTSDVTATWQIETLSFNCKESGAEITDVMPKWIDEDGNEIAATSGVHDYWGWDSTSFEYYFNVADFRSNGEYILLFPQGMLVNAAGEESAKVEVPYSFNVPDLVGAMFDDFKVDSIYPDLTQDQGVWYDQKISIETNHNDAIGLTKLIVTDLTEGEVVITSSNFSTGRVPGWQSSISWEVVGTYKFFEGHTYKAEITFFNGKDEKGEMGVATPIVDRVTYEFGGKVPPYQYSDVTLLSVEPTPGDYVISEPSQAVFTFVFSAPVNVWKAETPLGPAGSHVYSNSCLTSNADKTEWTLNVSDDSFILGEDTNLTINIYVKDEEGFTLRGNNGYEDNAIYQFSWDCELGAPTFTVVPAQGAVLDQLTQVVAKSDTNTEMAWSWNGSAYIMTLTRQLVGTLIPEPGEEAATQVEFNTWVNAETGIEEAINLTKGGSYVIVFEKGCFNFGTQYDTKSSHNMAIGFEITGDLYQGQDPTPGEQETFLPISATPAEGSIVESLSEIVLSFADEVGVNTYDAYLYAADDQAVESNYIRKAEIGYSWDDFNIAIITLESPVTEKGDYVLVIPARAIGTIDFCDSMGQAGICNPTLMIPYTVDPEYVGVETVSGVQTSDVYDVHGRIVMRGASREDLKTLPKGIYVFNGKKIIL